MGMRNALVRDLASHLAGGADLFRRRGIDYYRIGNMPLWQAAERHGCDLDTLVQDLSHLSPGGEAFPIAVHDLTSFIQRRYHALHLNRLFIAIRMARRIELDFAAHPACPNGLSRHLGALAEEIDAHQTREREEVFPALRYGRRSSQKFRVLRMMMEHDGFAEQLDTLAALTSNYTAPAGGSAEWALLYAACQHLDSELRFHIHLENNILYPRFVGERPMAA